MAQTRRVVGALLLAAMLTLSVGPKFVRPASAATPQAKKPNIIMIMSDDVGTWNIGASGH
jgi:hypothetical protein